MRARFGCICIHAPKASVSSPLDRRESGLSEVVALLVGALVLMSGVMAAGWAFQRRVANAGWSDVFWTFGTGFTLVAAALTPLTLLPGPVERRVLVALMAAFWSLRLGIHIAQRVASRHEDARYVEMRQTSGDRFQSQMLGLMMVQAPVSAALAFAVVAAAHAPGPLGLLDLVAVSVLVLSVTGEGLADLQLRRFAARPESRGAVCDEGLWALSRHPNYFFEWLVWLAYPVAAFGFGLTSPWFWGSLAAPVLMYLLLTRVSGVPPLERAMLASRGDAYRRYQARVPAFFPFPKRGDPR